MNEEKINDLIQKISTIIDAVIKSERKEKIKFMLSDEGIGDLFFTAPASSKKQYHLAEPGGLAQHSLNVYKNLRKINICFEMNLSEESMFISALFHDIGKACSTDLKSPHYIPVSEEWKTKNGTVYEYSDTGIYMTNHLRSIYILQGFQIKLTDEEFQAIYLNDGQYLDENRPYKLKECKLALALHMADRISLDQEKV